MLVDSLQKQEGWAARALAPHPNPLSASGARGAQGDPEGWVRGAADSGIYLFFFSGIRLIGKQSRI